MSAKSDQLTLEQLTSLVGIATGWGHDVSITYKRFFNDENRAFVSAGVAICGGHATVSATGNDHRHVLIVLLQNIESHHREVLRWHKSRMREARKILDEHEIYYVKTND